MPILQPPFTRDFSRVGSSMPVPPLGQCQERAFARLLEPGRGLDELLREVFPVRAHEGELSLHYERIELGEPPLDLQTCRQLRRSYARPLFLWLRLEGPRRVTQRVAFGALPVMVGGGEFLINGCERVVLGQLQRAPGIDFTPTSCRITPLRGARVELIFERRDILEAVLSPGTRLNAVTLLRALDPALSSDGNLLRRLHPVRTMDPVLPGAVVCDDLVDPHTGEVLLDAGSPVPAGLSGSVGPVDVLDGRPDELLLATLAEDQPRTHEQALLELHRLLRPGHPASLDRARQLLHEKFRDPSRYCLGRVGRFRIERRLGPSTHPDSFALSGDDLARAIRALLEVQAGRGEIDDEDHLANRRVRLVDELLVEELRPSLFKLRRVVQDRMRRADRDHVQPHELVNPKVVASALERFFARSELSQPLDQTNPLSQLAHERRLTASGPGGVDRKRARFSVRDVYLSYHGRLCPIETPEGDAVGLISHLALYAGLDEHGFLVTPYRVVREGVVTDDIHYLRADEEEGQALAPPDALTAPLPEERVMARSDGDFRPVPLARVGYLGVSPGQQMGLSTALIPFLEHDDANRALMGSNMQRQAVPLLVPEAPLVGTGLEGEAARQSALVVRALEAGIVTAIDARRVVVGEREYRLRKFQPSAAGTCIIQKPLVRPGQSVAKDQVIADGPATQGGELALGRNVIVAFMTWEGYNFEDAILISERLVREDVFTSIHIEELETLLRDNRGGEEMFTNRVPNVPAHALRHLDDSGVVRVGSHVLPGDILVGKTIPRYRPEQTPEMRLLHGLFGRGEERVGDSLEVPAGVTGVVIGVERDPAGSDLGPGVRERVRVRLASKRPIAVGDKMAGRHGNKGVISRILPVEDMPYLADGTPVDVLLNPLGVPSRMNVGQVLETHLGWAAATLGFKARTPVFDGATERQVRACLAEAGLPQTGKCYLYDGRSGQRFEQPVTVGTLYMLKLHHLVDDKVHARATGPYSLITQQPLGGKARFGGQRFGEMEVWALQAYGAAALLQEMLTIKSDDVEGRARTYDALVRGEEPPPPGTPASVEVLRHQLRGLGISLDLEEERSA